MTNTPAPALRPVGYVSMTDLGKWFGVSSHAIGKWLRENDLRTEDNSPSMEAFNRGLARKAPSGRNGGYFYVWHEKQIIHILSQAGHKPVSRC